MHVLIIPYNYPTDSFPINAIFIQEQVSALRRLLPKVGVLGAIPKTISMCVKSKKITLESGIGEKWVQEVPAVRGWTAINRFLALSVGKWLFKKYLLQNGKPDIVHVHNVQAADLAVWIKKNYKIPFVITEHSSHLWKIRKQDAAVVKNMKFLYEQSSENIAVSLVFASHLSGFFDLPFTYIPNVVDVDFFELNTSRLSDGNVRLVSIGNLNENKNHLALIKAVHKLIKKGYPLILQIGGEGKLRNALQKYIDANGLKKNVQLLGLLSKNEIRDLLKQTDYFILPSFKETFGVVLIEAMASGLPTLAFKVGGPESIITNDNVGKLIDSDANLVDGLVNLMSTEFSSAEIRKYAQENFSFEAVAGRLAHLYLDVLND